MNPHDLDDLLAREARRSLPPAPNLRTAVRAGIAHRQDRSIWTRLLPVLHWRELTLHPQLAAAALMLALLAAMLPGVVVNHLSSDRDIARQARSSLHLDIFSIEQAGRPWIAPPTARTS